MASKYFWPFWWLSSSSCAGQGVAYIKNAINDKSVTFSCVSKLFLLSFMIEVSKEECWNLWKLTFLSVFDRYTQGPGANHVMFDGNRLSFWMSGQLFLFSFVIVIAEKERSNLRKMVIFKYFWPLWSVSPRVWVVQWVIDTTYPRNS